MSKKQNQSVPPASGPYRSNSRLIWHFLKGCKRYFLWGILTLALVSVLEMLNPQIISFAIDSVIDSIEPTEFPQFLLDFIAKIGGRDYFRAHMWVIALTIILIAFLAVMFRYFYRIFNARGGERFVERIRNALYGHIESLPYAMLNENMTGDLIQRCTSDVNTVKRFISEQLTSIVRIVILLALAFFFMFRMNWKLSLIAAAFIPVIVLYSLFFRIRIERNFRRCDEEEGVLSTVVQENLTGVRVVRAFGREKYELDKFRAKNDHFRDSWVKLADLMSFFWNFGDLFSALQVMAVVLCGTVFCVRGELTPGNLIAFISYNSMLIWPVRHLGRTISEMSKANVSINRIRYILLMEPEKDPENPETPDMRADIVFDHVGFSYADGVKTLDDVSFSIGSGQTVGILGSTGSGKSTLMYLLTRLYDPDEGRITVGGVPLENIPRQYVRRNIGIVLQEPYLFSRTLGENIRITCADMPEETFAEAVSTASLDETVQKLTNGLDTVVGERGVTLSGGQKQRTAIARMMTGKPPVMIFDDSLSAVDTETDAKIRDALRKKCAGSTVVLISHRVTTLMDADLILVLDKGRIVESGTHGDLMRRGGVYRRIHDIQNQNMEEVTGA